MRAPTCSSAEPVTHAPLRDADIAPVTDGAAAIVIAAGDVAKRACDRPAWIRGIEHRIEPLALGVRDLTRSESTRLAAEAAGVAGGSVDVAELHTQFSHEEPILRAALGLGRRRRRQPVGRSARRQPDHVDRPHPHRRGRDPDHRRRRRPRRRARDPGPVPATEPRLRARRGERADGRRRTGVRDGERSV